MNFLEHLQITSDGEQFKLPYLFLTQMSVKLVIFILQICKQK